MYGLAIELKRHADETKFSTQSKSCKGKIACLVLRNAIRHQARDGVAWAGRTAPAGGPRKTGKSIRSRIRNVTTEIAYKETTRTAEGHYRHKNEIRRRRTVGRRCAFASHHYRPTMKKDSSLRQNGRRLDSEAVHVFDREGDSASAWRWRGRRIPHDRRPRRGL